jgi:hypothetical protein
MAIIDVFLEEIEACSSALDVKARLVNSGIELGFAVAPLAIHPARP